MATDRENVPARSKVPASSAFQGRIEGIVRPLVAAANLDLVALHVRSGSRGVVRLVLAIDRLPGAGAISLDDCAAVSRKLAAVLDAEERAVPDYELEVSSPGMNRPLRHEADYLRFVGTTAKFAVEPAGEPRETVVGRIAKVGDGLVTVEQGKDRTRTFACGTIQAATLQPTIEQWQTIGDRLRSESKPADVSEG
ncbi:MAG: ribosome maturation factor RimP [Myxococcales bacterium]|nr:ribosome maturation factor RimP [Myxococcales bacterium]